VVAATTAESVHARKADFSHLFGDSRLADVLIKVKLKVSEEAGSVDSGGGTEEATPPKKRARAAASAAEAGSEGPGAGAGAAQQLDEDAGVVLTL
jgi:hypothetical protein